MIKKTKILLSHFNSTFSSAETHLQMDEAGAATANRARHKLFDQSKCDRNHEKLKMDFRCRVILRTSIGREFNWLFVCDGLRLRKLKELNHFFRGRKPSVQF